MFLAFADLNETNNIFEKSGMLSDIQIAYYETYAVLFFFSCLSFYTAEGFMKHKSTVD